MTKHKHAEHVGALGWRIQTVNLILDMASQAPDLERDLDVFVGRLKEVANRALVLDDPELNALMLQLGIYGVADKVLFPDQKGYRIAIEEQSTRLLNLMKSDAPETIEVKWSRKSGCVYVEPNQLRGSENSMVKATYRLKE